MQLSRSAREAQLMPMACPASTRTLVATTQKVTWRLASVAIVTLIAWPIAARRHTAMTITVTLDLRAVTRTTERRLVP